MNISIFSTKKNRSRKTSSFTKKVMKPIKRHGFLVVNILLVGVVAVFLVQGRRSSNGASIRNNQSNASTVSVAVLDQISSADIAVNIAQAARLPEVYQVRNQADTRNTLISIPVSNDVVVAKPQIITDATSGTQSRKDILEYTTVEGDTITSIAQKFSLSAESLKWSNGMTSDNVAVGSKLVLPPKNLTGLVYKPSSNDTIEKLADKYKVTADKIIKFNDLELTNTLPTDEYIFIQDGEKPPEVRPTINYGSSYGSFTANFGGNGYAGGWCTWWAAERRAQMGRPIPSNLGNAATWLVNAQSAGYGTGVDPQPGAIIWYKYIGGAGHVSIVEGVNPDGSIDISAMNDTGGGVRGGWGIVSRYTVPAARMGEFVFIY